MGFGQIANHCGRLLCLSRPRFDLFFSPLSRNISSLMDGGAYMSVAGSWSDTPRCAADSGQDLVAVFSAGEGEITSYKRIDVRFCLISSRETTRGACPLCPCWLKQSSAGAWGKCLGRSVKCKWHKWNRHLKGRRCTESRRTTILSGMTIHSTPMYPAQPLKSWSSSLLQFPGIGCVEGDCNKIP